MAGENGNGYKKLSWKLILLLISIFISIVGFNYWGDMGRGARINSLAEGTQDKIDFISEKKLDEKIYDRDRIELLDRLGKMDKKLDTLILRP